MKPKSNKEENNQSSPLILDWRMFVNLEMYT